MLNCCSQIAFIGPGGPEILVVMLVLLLMFGAKDAPKIFRKINEMLNSIRNTADGFKREIMYGDLNSDSSSEDMYSDNDEDDYTEYHDDDYDYTDDDEERDYSDETFQNLEKDLEESGEGALEDHQESDEEADDARKA
ncbi:hypothetical protein P4C99_02165 [Pontiellaceae bacterium B1224]|nr:hypothetical protein [Pontiellaceae bacterium B1224]